MKVISVYSVMAVAAMSAVSMVAGTPSAEASTVCFGGDAGPSTCTLGEEQKVYLDSSNGVTSFEGRVGSQTGTPIVDFTAGTKVNVANGNAGISPVGNSFGSLDIETPGYSFTGAVLNLQMLKTGTGSSRIENLTIEALYNSVVMGTYTYNNLQPNAKMSFSVVATSGMLTELVLTSSTGFKDAKQFNLSGIAPIASGGLGPIASGVPEPATWAMMLAGFAGLGFAGWRKAKSGLALGA